MTIASMDLDGSSGLVVMGKTVDLLDVGSNLSWMIFSTSLLVRPSCDVFQPHFIPSIGQECIILIVSLLFDKCCGLIILGLIFL